jgi:myosin heavy subunit
LRPSITQVSYNVTNFLEKNKDALHEDIRAVICSSTCSLYAGLLPPPESAAKEAARYDVCVQHTRG